MTSLFRSGRRQGMLLAMLLSAATVAAGIGLMGTSGWLIARAAEHPEASALTLAAVGVRALGLGRGVLRYAERLVGHDAVLRWMAQVRVVVFERLAAQPGRWRTSEALAALGRDVEGLQDLWLRGLLPCAAAATVGVATVAGSTLVLPAAGVVLGVGLLLASVGVPAMAWWLASREAPRATVQADHLDALTDLLHGCADLVACQGTDGALRRVDVTTAVLRSSESATAARVAALSAFGLLAQGATVVGVAWVAATAVSRGQLEPVWAVVLGLLALAAFEPTAGLTEAALSLRNGREALRRLRSLEEQPAASLAVGDGGDELLVARRAGLDRPGRSLPAVMDVNLELHRGRSVAVLGGSGAGKSTLLALLAGQVVPTRGEVLCAGAPAARLTQEQRPLRVVLVEQDAHVFDASLRDNLRLGRPDATDDELTQVLDTVGLGSWLGALPAGLGTHVAHRGATLSGGQRRRLAVARGLLSHAPVLLLDEPTEGLAPVEADELLDAILAAARDRSVVVVTHRLSVLDRVDEALVLERGRVVAQGTPDQVRRSSALVRDAAAMQNPGYRLVG